MKKQLLVILLAVISSLTFAQAWTVNPASFEFSMNVIGQVSIDDNIIDQQISYIGAFVDDVCVGVCQPIEVSGEYTLFYLTVYSNQSSGENIEFKFADESENETLISNSIAFSSDAIIGSSGSPFLWMDEAQYASSDFLSFSFVEEFSPAVINSTDKTIDIIVTHDTDLSSLTPSFEIAPAATAKVNNVLQESEVTSNDYSEAVEYIVEGVDNSTSTWTVNVSLDFTAIHQFNSEAISVFPNPANDFVYIAADNIHISNIKLIDIAGKVYSDFVPNTIDCSQYTISTKNLKSGLYFILIQSGENKYIRKLIKM